LLLLVIAIPCEISRAAMQPPAQVIVFDVMQNAGTIFISPVVLFQGGRFGPPYSTAGGEGARRRFVEKYFPLGKTYFLIFGGGNAGSLKIRSGYWQDGVYAYGELVADPEAEGRIRGQIHALATDYDTTARGSAWRRSLTATERAAAIDLAKTSFLENKVPATALARMEVSNLTAIDVDGDNKAELVGSFKIPQTQSDKPPHFLFLIAEGEGQTYKTARANYQFNPDQAEYPLGLEMFAEYLDIDGDGTSEIVTVSTGRAFKDFFLVYQRKNGKWSQVFSGGGAH
jgi:hypothetical protein